MTAPAQCLRAGRRHTRTLRKRSAFPATDTELSDIAVAANIGESMQADLALFAVIPAMIRGEQPA